MMNSYSSSDHDVIHMADPDLVRWSTNATETLKRSVRRGAAKFWRKRGMAEPRERFVPTQFGKGEQ